jgi:glycerophosphoryl diester phosphodiesterase
MYPENTLTAFGKAAKIPGLEGIELDIQFTSDGHMVVIHDERVDRTTNGKGFVRDYTLKEIQALRIDSVNGEIEKIPTINEVLDLIGPAMRKGLKLNIELKTSVYPYIGIEKKIVELVKERGLTDRIVWSSFSALSLPIIRELLPDADIGMLADRASDCMRIHKAGIGTNALHPYARAMDLSKEELEGMTVRAWFLKHLYPEKPTGNRLDFKVLEEQGITDVFLNEPEVYLQ